MQYGKSQEATDRLTFEQGSVAEEAGVERPFTGEYNDHAEASIYVNIVPGEPLLKVAFDVTFDMGRLARGRRDLTAILLELSPQYVRNQRAVFGRCAHHAGSACACR
jgi:hypothetical protein